MRDIFTAILSAITIAVVPLSDAFADTKTYTITGKVISTFPNFFKYNKVEVGCTGGCTGRVPVAANGAFTLVETLDVGSSETHLVYYVSGKVQSNVIPYNVECNEDGYGQTVSHSTVSGTYVASPFVFRNLDLKATSVSMTGTARPGAKVRVRARVDNVGDQTIYDAFNVGVYLLNGKSFATSSKWTYIGKYPVTPNFEPNYYDEQTVAITLPKTLKRGTYYLGIIADDNTDLVECYVNNDFVAGLPVDNDYFASKRAIKVQN